MSLSKIAPKLIEKPKNRLTLPKKNKVKHQSERFRPVDQQKTSEILGDNENKNTVRSEQKVNRILSNYLQEIKKEGNYWEFEIEDLDKVLGTFLFVVSPQKEGSDHYTVSSLHHIRYAIKRILQNKGRVFDITTDPKFAHRQHMFKETCKELKRKGFGHVKRTDDILPTGRSTHFYCFK